MISLVYSQIPAYLHETQFYGALDAEMEEISIPSQCFKPHSLVTNETQFMQLLHVVRFWGFPSIPFSIIDYALSGDIKNWEEVQGEFGAELVFLKDLEAVCVSKKEDQMKTAVKSGLLSIVRYLHYDNGVEFGEYDCTEAALLGHRDILLFALENGASGADADAGAAQGGWLDCLRIAYYHSRDWDEHTTRFAALGGHLNCLEFAHSNGCPIGPMDTCTAASMDHLNCLQYLHDHGCELHTDCTALAAAVGHLECLKFVLQHGCLDDGTGDAIANALVGGHLDCVILLVEAGFTPPKNLFGDDERAFEQREPHQPCSDEQFIVMLRYMLEHGWQWSPETVAQLAQCGFIECVKLAVASGISLTEAVAINAAAYGQLEILQYAATHGCLLGPEVMFAACEAGSLECLECAHAHGCPMEPTACFWAAIQALPKLLRESHESGCPWDERIPDAIAQNINNYGWSQDAADCMQYALDNDCPALPGVNYHAYLVSTDP